MDGKCWGRIFIVLEQYLFNTLLISVKEIGEVEVRRKTAWGWSGNHNIYKNNYIGNNYNIEHYIIRGTIYAYR